MKAVVLSGKKPSELSDEIEIFPQVLRNAKVKNENKNKFMEDSEVKAAIEKVEKDVAGLGRLLTVSYTHLITGGPGTGKTTIINTIINILEESGLKTAIAAPTGRAAKRITETSGHYASTIHRLLEYYFSESENMMRFGKTKEDPLDYDAVIVDEASMIDLMLMNGLVSAVRPGTRLIICLLYTSRCV